MRRYQIFPTFIHFESKSKDWEIQPFQTALGSGVYCIRFEDDLVEVSLFIFPPKGQQICWLSPCNCPRHVRNVRLCSQMGAASCSLESIECNAVVKRLKAAGRAAGKAAGKAARCKQIPKPSYLELALKLIAAQLRQFHRVMSLRADRRQLFWCCIFLLENDKDSKIPLDMVPFITLIFPYIIIPFKHLNKKDRNSSWFAFSLLREISFHGGKVSKKISNPSISLSFSLKKA